MPASTRFPKFPIFIVHSPHICTFPTQYFRAFDEQPKTVPIDARLLAQVLGLLGLACLLALARGAEEEAQQVDGLAPEGVEETPDDLTPAEGFLLKKLFGFGGFGWGGYGYGRGDSVHSPGSTLPRALVADSSDFTGKV